MGLRHHYSSKAHIGSSHLHDSPVLPQDNPEFMSAYSELLSRNDRVLYREGHADQAGVAFLKSDENLLAMKELGYDKIFLEIPRQINPLIAQFYMGSVTEGEFKSQFLEQMFEQSLILTPNAVREKSDVLYSGYADLIKTMKTAGIQVVCYDDWERAVSSFTKPDDENAHIDLALFRRDSYWDPFIAQNAQNDKILIHTGSFHASTSYGIDEYLGARGHSIGTFRIKGDEYIENNLISKEDYLDPAFDARAVKQYERLDNDGIDYADVASDIHYDVETSRVLYRDEQNKMYGIDPEANTIDASVNPSILKPFKF